MRRVVENSLFRKSTLERLSSPEKLDEYVKVTNPETWVVLLGLFVFLLAVAIWAYTGTILETTRLLGIVFTKPGDVQRVYCFVPMGASRKLVSGMAVQVSPDYAPREEYGYIYGTVEQIGEAPADEGEILGIFGSAQYATDFLTQANMVVVQVALEKDRGTLRWSTQKAVQITVKDGSYCDVLVVLRVRKPYELVFR